MPRDKNPDIGQLVPALLNWYSRNARDLPWRRTQDPYAIWVSEIMLQQTQVKTVVPYWERWMRKLPTARRLANARSDTIHKLWEGLGYYTRVRNMQRAAQLIVKNHRGEFPTRFEDVFALPGIGRYTAGAICSIAFNQPTPILDGNVIRVLTRLFAVTGNPREKRTNERLWELAEQLVTHASRLKIDDSRPARPASELNQALMELGALICAPHQPQCDQCPLAAGCVARRAGRVDALPNLGKRISATPRQFAAFLVEQDRKFLVRQRPAGVVNAHLWEFPNAEIIGRTRTLAAGARQALGSAPLRLEPFCTVKHSITRYRITLEAFGAHFANGFTKTIDGEWVTAAGLQKLSFPSAHRKIAEHLLRRDSGKPVSHR